MTRFLFLSLFLGFLAVGFVAVAVQISSGFLAFLGFLAIVCCCGFAIVHGQEPVTKLGVGRYKLLAKSNYPDSHRHFGFLCIVQPIYEDLHGKSTRGRLILATLPVDDLSSGDIFAVAQIKSHRGKETLYEKITEEAE